MSEREMLERAAAAAGIKVIRSRLDDPSCKDLLIENSPRNQLGDLGPWNSLTDDGDCGRLEAVLLLHVEWHPATKSVYVGTAEVGCTRPWGNDRQGARRYAATRAAAALAPTAQGE